LTAIVANPRHLPGEGAAGGRGKGGRRAGGLAHHPALRHPTPISPANASPAGHCDRSTLLTPIRRRLWRTPICYAAFHSSQRGMSTPPKSHDVFMQWWMSDASMSDSQAAPSTQIGHRSARAIGAAENLRCEKLFLGQQRSPAQMPA